MADAFSEKQYDVFISYRRKDSSTLAKLIESQLEKYGINAFLDVTDIQETGSFSDHLQTAIATADFFVCLLGAETLDSEWVLNEIEYACQHNKILIPVLQESFVHSDNYPPSAQLLLKQQGINVLDKRGLYIEQAIDNLARLIKPQAVSTPARAVPMRGGNPTQSRNRERMLQSVKDYWIDGVLENSLHGAALIELGLEQSAEQVANPWDTILRMHNEQERSLKVGETIVDVFAQMHGKLLILGDPGGGKTTTLLHLTKVLLTRAETDAAQPIPAVFNLSSWADKRHSLAEWLVDELNEKYNAPRKVAQQWIEDDTLLVLLDGLDEVELSARNACVEAINTFRNEHGFVDIVVCSRTHDYEALSAQLKLDGAVVIQPLTDNQVDDYLSGLGTVMDTLRQLLVDDTNMKTLAQTPLMLSIMALAFQNVAIKDVKHYATLEEQRSYIFDLYIARMFKRRAEGHSYPAELTQHYLEWLAREQTRQQQTLFHIEGLQETYLPENWQRSAYRFLHRTFAGLGIGGFIGALSGLLLLFGIWLIGSSSVFTLSWQANALYIARILLLGMLIGSAVGAALFIPAGLWMLS